MKISTWKNAKDRMKVDILNQFDSLTFKCRNII